MWGWCDRCGQRAHTCEVSFSRNIGVLIMRSSVHESGQYCASCICTRFLAVQLLNMLLGWWGLISFFMTIFYSVSNLMNLVTGLGTLALGRASRRAADGARAIEREQTDADAELPRFRNTIRMRLRNGESVAVVARDMADAARVPERTALAYVERLALELSSD